MSAVFLFKAWVKVMLYMEFQANIFDNIFLYIYYRKIFDNILEVIYNHCTNKNINNVYNCTIYGTIVYKGEVIK